MALAIGFFFGYKIGMRLLLLLLLLLLLCASASAEEKFWAGGQQVTQEELNAALDVLMEAFWWEISSPSFQERLQHNTDWRYPMVQSLLLRYPQGPWGDRHAGRGNPEFERSLNAVIEAAPAELAPRILALTHCDEVVLEPPIDCMRRHATALDQQEPDNALGPLFLAQAALARDDVTEAAAWMEQAATRKRLRHGYWAIIKAQFEVFADAEPLIDDPLNLLDVAREGLAEAMITHRVTHPVNVLGRQCQGAADEPLMTGCLATARAMKLPGTGRLAYNLALAIEERIYQQRGDQGKLAALALERQSLKHRFDQVAAVQAEMIRKGKAAPMLEAYVDVGELDTVIDFGATLAKAEATGDHHQMVLKASTSERLRCVEWAGAAPEAPDCITPEMVKAEVERLTEVLDDRMQEEPFRQRLAADPSAEAQIFRLFAGRTREDALSTDRSATATLLADRFPAHPWANRLVANLCIENPKCLQGAAERLMKHEPDDALGYLLAAVHYLDVGDPETAAIYLQRAGGAKRLQGAFGLTTAIGADVITRHMGSAPDSDVLGVWDMVPATVSLGYAAALSLPSAKLSHHCFSELEESAIAGCLTAARAMQLPGGSLIESIMGLELETRLLKSANHDELGKAIDRLARVRQLRDDVVSSVDRFISDPSVHHQYLEQLGTGGELAALRWMLSHAEHDDDL